MMHEYNLPFEAFEKFSLTLAIIRKQQNLIQLMSKETYTKEDIQKIKLLNNAIDLMISKLIENDDNGIVHFILDNL